MQPKIGELVNSMQQEYEFVNEVAQRCREERDRFNGQVKTLATRLNALNGATKILKQAAVEHCQARNLLNKRVKDGKVERDQLNVAANTKQEVAMGLRNKLMPHDNTLLNQLKRDFKINEKRQMNSVMSLDSEKKLVESLSKTHREMEAIEKKIAGHPEIKAAEDEFNIAREESEIQHALVSRLAVDAQSEHAIMSDVFRKRDALADEADAVHETMMKIKEVADEEHQKFIKYSQMARIFRITIAVLTRRGGKMTTQDSVIGKLFQGGKLDFKDLAVVKVADKKRKFHKKQNNQGQLSNQATPNPQ